MGAKPNMIAQKCQTCGKWFKDEDIDAHLQEHLQGQSQEQTQQQEPQILTENEEARIRAIVREENRAGKKFSWPKFIVMLILLLIFLWSVGLL